MPAISDPRQHQLPLHGAPLDCDQQLRAAMAEAMAASGRDRDAIAAEMTRLSGRTVTKAKLDAWTATSKGAWTIPACLLPAFVEVTGATEILQLLLEPLGLIVVTEDAADLAELGRVVADQNRLARTKRHLTKKLGVRR